MIRIKFRVWWNGQMIYSDTADKACDWLIDQSGKLQSFPSKLGEVYDPARFEGGVYMLYTGNKGVRYEIYQDDIIRDDEDRVGLVFWDDEDLIWAVSFTDGITALSRYDQKDGPDHYGGMFYEKPLVSLGNKHQHPDWAQWDGEWPAEPRRETPKPT